MAQKEHKILHVDDSFIFRDTFKTFLEDEGYELISVHDGQIDSESILDEEYDLIISDMEMPIMDGMEFLKKVRESHLNKETPFLFYNGYQDEAFRAKGKAAGANHFISKSHSPMQVLATIAKMLNE